MQLPHSLLYLVTDAMPIGVVNQFKTIKITEDYRQKPVISSGQGNCLFCASREIFQIGYTKRPGARNATTEISTSM